MISHRNMSEKSNLQSILVLYFCIKYLNGKLLAINLPIAILVLHTVGAVIIN